VPGASEKARRVKIMNANWVADADGEDGRFELMIPDDRTLIAADLRGTIAWTEDAATPAT
jgi:hypothetical protein